MPFKQLRSSTPYIRKVPKNWYVVRMLHTTHVGNNEAILCECYADGNGALPSEDDMESIMLNTPESLYIPGNHTILETYDALPKPKSEHVVIAKYLGTSESKGRSFNQWNIIVWNPDQTRLNFDIPEPKKTNK